MGWIKLKIVKFGITDWESVKILITELQGAVKIAERIERSSALYDEGHDCILAEYELIIWLLLSIWIQPMPIVHWLVPISITDPSV